MRIKRLIMEFIKKEVGLSQILKQITQLLQQTKNIRTLKQFCKFNFDSIHTGSSRMVCDYDDELTIKIALPSFDERGGLTKGTYQNQLEYEMCVKNRKNPLFTRVYYKDPYYRWIVSERVLPATEEDFKNIIGIPFTNSYTAIKRQNSSTLDIDDDDDDEDEIVDYTELTKYQNKQYDEDKFYGVTFTDFLDICSTIKAGLQNDLNIRQQHLFPELINTNKFFKQVASLMFESNMAIGDMYLMDNWGIADRDGEACVVYLDCGIDNNGMNMFYKMAY